ncbi:MAG: zinc-binding dehydrogenase [Firmicutes bacterium]|nr:zinc-binding dehydrogenase [Bacillota bacterium]
MSETYRALEYSFRPGRVLWQRLTAAILKTRIDRSLRLTTRQDVATIAEKEGWVPLAPVLSGICGSDLAILRGRSSPYLAPLVSFPAVFGHEVVARTLDSQARRVVVNPTLSCQARNLPLCSACKRGETDECANRDEKTLGPGLLIGYTRSAPGGWSTCMWAPATQLIDVPGDLADERALLAEPTAIVLEGLRRSVLQPCETVLILGAGPIGLLALALARHHMPRATLAVRSRYPAQSLMAEALGADRVLDAPHDKEVMASPALDDIAGKAREALWGALPYRTGGFDLTIDSVGSGATLQMAFALTRPGGAILLLGGAHQATVDFTPLWSRRLTVYGTFGYAHGHGFAANRTFAEAIEWLKTSPAPLERLVTHRFPLEDYPEAFRVLGHRASGALKVAFAPNP